MGIKDILDNSGTSIDYNKVMSQLSSVITSMNSNTSPLRMITIKNPEELNVRTSMWSGEWVIEYMGRDLSLEEDNYRWDVYKSGIRGYYIIEREIQHHNWLWVRWGKTPTNVRERREHIDKKRLKDKSMIQKDMITAIRSLIK
jgi:hypothetical protein